jgi:hypothetical protein
MISFRVSETEFELLKTRSEAEGARSVSEFARVALCTQANGQLALAAAPSAAADAAEIARLRDELQELNGQVRRVADLLEPSLASASSRLPMLAVGRKNGGA